MVAVVSKSAMPDKKWETYRDKSGKLIISNGHETMHVNPQAASMSRAEFERELESMRAAAANAGATQDFVLTQEYARQHLLNDPGLQGYQSYEAFLSLLRPIARRDRNYVKKDIHVVTRDPNTGREVTLEPDENVVQEIVQTNTEVGTFERVRDNVDRLRAELHKLRTSFEEDAGRRQKKRQKYSIKVTPNDLKSFRVDEPDAVILRHRRLGSVVDAVRAMPSRAKRALGRNTVDEYAHQTSTYEDAAAEEVEQRTVRSKAQSVGKSEEAWVGADRNEKTGRAPRFSQKYYIDKGYDKDAAKRLSQEQYRRRVGRQVGTAAWFREQGHKDEDADALAETFHGEHASWKARPTSDPKKYAAADATTYGSVDYFRVKGFTKRQAESLSRAAFLRSYRPMGTATSEVTRATGKGMFSVFTLPFKAMGWMGKSASKGAKNAYDRAGGEGNEGWKKAGEAAKTTGKSAWRRITFTGSREEYNKRKDELVADGKSEKSAKRRAAITTVGKRTWEVAPGVILTTGLAKYARKAYKEDEEFQKKGKLRQAVSGLGLLSKASLARVGAWYMGMSLAARVVVMLGVVLMMLTMPLSVFKYAIHFVYMLTLMGLDYLLLVPVNAVLQLAWFVYDALVNFVLNIVIHGVVGVVNDLLIRPLLKAMTETMGFTFEVARPTFSYAGTVVPQLAYLTAVMKSSTFLPDVVPMDGYGNLNIGPDMEADANSFVTQVPPPNAREVGSAAWNEWMLQRLRDMTGCNPHREDCFERYSWTTTPNGQIRFRHEPGAPALLDKLIVPPNFGLSQGGFGESLLPDIQWYTWVDLTRPGESGPNGRIDEWVDVNQNGVFDDGESELYLAGGPFEAAGIVGFDWRFEDTALGKVMNERFGAVGNFNMWTARQIAEMQCRIDFEGVEQEECLRIVAEEFEKAEQEEGA